MLVQACRVVRSRVMKRWFWVIDAIVVILFAIIGREDHGFASDIGDYLRVSAPFLIGLGITIVLVRAWRDPVYWLTGLFLALGTVAFGMLLRALVWDNGTARTFVFVTTGFMVAAMVGWRLVVRGIAWLVRRGATSA